MGQRHFDVQLMGGMTLHAGKIAEMKTGEGKTLVSTLAAYLNGLPGEGVHLITVNDYLARRDCQWMGPIFHFLGLTVSCLQHEASFQFAPGAEGGPFEDLIPLSRRDAYSQPTLPTAPTTSSDLTTFGTTWPATCHVRCRET